MACSVKALQATGPDAVTSTSSRSGPTRSMAWRAWAAAVPPVFTPRPSTTMSLSRPAALSCPRRVRPSAKVRSSLASTVIPGISRFISEVDPSALESPTTVTRGPCAETGMGPE
ncbi:hypothetical protein B6D25_05555 [Micrococcus luteus]|nr:hypothetical protein BF96_09905 [Micrococcus luteus]ORE61785.1 hypothetical protein B6D25_05555 [Micrococcus luteus]